MSNLPKMECLENYIVKYIHVTRRANFFTDNVFYFHSQSTSYFKDKLINEILENRILLGDSFKKYLELVNQRIKKETNFIIEDCILEEWKIKYNLEEFVFYPINIKDFKTALHSFGTKLDLINDEIIPSLEKHIDYEIFEFHCASIEIINLVNSYLVEDKTDTGYKELAWFKVGLLFASGKMEKFYSVNDKGLTVLKNNYTFPKVASELGDKSLKKDINITINNYGLNNSNGGKNIFNSREKMNKIISHCKENNIAVIPYFLTRLPSE